MALPDIIRRWHIRDQIPLREIAARSLPGNLAYDKIASVRDSEIPTFSGQACPN